MGLSRASTPLRLSDFTFFGFDGLLDPLERMLQEVVIRHGEPVAPTVENAVFVPARPVAGGGFEGALLTRDGQPIPTALAQRRLGAFGDQTMGALRDPVPIKPDRLVEEEVVYLGWCHGHFGHVLLESLARIWIVEWLEPSVKVVFHIEKETDLAGSAGRILDAFGLSRDRILVLDREAQTLLRRVIVPEPLFELSTAIHERMAAPFQRVAAPLVRNAGTSDQPIYLSRRLLSGTHRPIVGEFELEEILRENGFLVVHPETMEFVEQIRLINRHRDIVTSAGAAAYLSLFAVQSPRLHVLTAGIPYPDYFLTAKAAGIEATFAKVFSGADSLSLHYLPQLVDVDQVAAYLDSIGLLRTRRRAALTSRVHDFTPAYDEARLYAETRHAARRERLPSASEDAALRLATASWPLGWGLACYFLTHDRTRVDEVIQLIIPLLSAETDGNRLAHYYPHVADFARRIARGCSPPTAARLAAVLTDRFGIDLDLAPERSGPRRARPGARFAATERRAERSDRRRPPGNGHTIGS